MVVVVARTWKQDGVDVSVVVVVAVNLKFVSKSNFANTNFHAFRIIFTKAYLVNVEVSIYE